MVQCEICGKEFKNNLGGNLTVHLLSEHNLTMEDYYILTKLNGIEPKCNCGLCDERPFFHRGKFSKFAINHNTFEWQEKRYVELYGQPKCENIGCDNVVDFHRGKPNKYCSHKCQPNNWNQLKINKTVNDKYGVNNVSQLQSIKDKIIETNINKYGVKYHQELPEFNYKLKVANVNKYGVEVPQMLPKFVEKKRITMIKKYGVDHYSKTNKFKEIVSKNMCKYNENTLSNHKIKYYKNTHIYYQSLHEYRFLEYCEAHDLLQFVDNSPTFRFVNNRWHLPDFKFKNTFIIEIKSSYWLKRQGGLEKIKAKKESVELKGYRYIFILDENYREFFENCL